MLKEGDFHLTKFSRSRKEVLQALPSQERSIPTLNPELDRLPINLSSSLHWHAERDVFCFKTVSTNKPSTKCRILSTIRSLFDPFRFLLSIILPTKVLLQMLWRENIKWDEETKDHHLQVWQKYTHSVPLIKVIQIPRC